MAAVRHLEFSNVHIIWSYGCHCVPNMLLCTTFHQNRMIFHWDIAIWRYSRWPISAMLNFMGPTMGSLESPCKTYNRSSVETIALNCIVFEKIAFLCTHFGDRQTDRQTNRWTASIVEATTRCRERRLNKRTQCSLDWTEIFSRSLSSLPTNNKSSASAEDGRPYFVYIGVA